MYIHSNVLYMQNMIKIIQFPTAIYVKYVLYNWLIRLCVADKTV